MYRVQVWGMQTLGTSAAPAPLLLQGPSCVSHALIFPSVFHAHIHSSFFLSPIYPSIHPVTPFSHTFLPSIHPSTCPFILPPTRPQPLSHPVTHPSLHSLIRYLFCYPSIHPVTHPFKRSVQALPSLGWITGSKVVSPHPLCSYLSILHNCS